jgi:hypothetical protein
MKQKLLALAVVSALAMGSSTAALAGTTYKPFGNGSVATGGRPGHAALLVSDASNAKPYAGLNLTSTTVTTLAELTSLATDYQLVVGDCGGGSPRFEIGLPGDKYISVYVGPAPSFIGCAAGWQSTGNLLTATDLRVDTTQIGGTFYDTWAHALTLAGSSAVSSIALVVDSSWSSQAAPAGVQTVLVDNVQVNGDVVGFEPAPATGVTMIVPLAAKTGSYASEITVHNPFPDDPLPVAVFYTGANGTSAAGQRACDPLSVAPQGSVQFSIAQQCHLPSGSQYGYVTMTESAGTPSPFVAYSRAQTPDGNGFSVPAYPSDAIEAPKLGTYVVGLKRQASAPKYQSNCFVASTDTATTYQIRLRDGNGNPVGNLVTGSLEANQMVRYLDIFTAAGVPTGDQSNVSAVFSNVAGDAPLIGYCTVQESTFFGADFRMAQPPKLWRYDPL